MYEAKKAQLDTYRPLPYDTVRRLNEDLKVLLTYHSNAIEGNSLLLRPECNVRRMPYK